MRVSIKHQRTCRPLWGEFTPRNRSVRESLGTCPHVLTLTLRSRGVDSPQTRRAAESGAGGCLGGGYAKHSLQLRGEAVLALKYQHSDSCCQCC